MSVIRLFEQGLYTNNQICVLPELVASFKSNWAKLVVTNHFPIFALPFYHLCSEPFWKLVANAGCEKWVESKSSMRSFSNLTTAVKYALIDKKPIYISSLRGNISKHKNAVSRFLGSIFKNKNIFRHITAFSFTVL